MAVEPQIAHEVVNAGLAGTFGLDLKIFIAQLVNFTIVLLVLKKFVFAPVVKVLDDRKAAVDKGMNQAEEAELRLKEIALEREKTMQDARRDASELIRTAQGDALRLAERMKEQAKSEVESVVKQGKERLRIEQDSLRRELAEDVSTLIVEAAGKVLGQSLDDKKGQKVADAAVAEWLTSRT